MAYRVVLVSDDADFFDYIKNKISLRKSDEVFTFSFDEILTKIPYFATSAFIINSESSKQKTLELLRILNGLPVIVFSFNEDDDFKFECYKSGAFDYVTVLVNDREFEAKLLPVLTVSGILQKNSFYREILASKDLINSTNEVFSDYSYILDMYLNSIKNNTQKVVFMAIAPSDKDKLLLPSNKIETILLNNIRKNDVVMSYASNKYFVLLFDIDLNGANKMWEKLRKKFSYPIYAGICSVTNQKREQLISEALNKLHIAINNGKHVTTSPLSEMQSELVGIEYNNFKLYKKEFEKKLEQVITPVFYQIQQKYSKKLSGITLQQNYGEGYGTFYIKGKHFNSCFRITCPGFSKINIDITFQKSNDNVDTKRISLEPSELEQGLLTDLLEQYLNEFNEV